MGSVKKALHRQGRTAQKNEGIQRRWVRSIISWILVFVVLCVFAVTAAITGYCYSDLRSGLQVKAKTTSDFFSNYGNLSYNEFFQTCVTYAQTFEDKNTIELQFINRSGGIVASSYGQWAGIATNTADITQALEGGEISVFTGRSPSTGERIMAVSSPILYVNGEIIGVLRFVTSLRNVDKQILLIALLAAVIGALAVFLVLMSSKFFLRSILDPVLEITATAKRIASGSYGAQIQTKYNDEIGKLADTINEMSIQISQTEKMQSEFVSSVSHELRTPLTAITGWGETLLATEEMDPVQTRRGMLIILRETKRLTQMVEELLEFTRMQDGRFTLNVEKCNILEAFEDTVFMYGSRLRQEGIELSYMETEDPIPEILCDASRLRQVFLNILDNAVKHGGTGKRVTAAMTLEDGFVVVRIRDFGPGIPPEELPLVKKKFYKGNSKARGSGIGLAVCDEIVSRHNGTLELSNAEGGGTLVTIRLPATES